MRTIFLEGPCSPKWLLRSPLKSLCLRRFEIEYLQAVDDIVHPPKVFFLFFSVRTSSMYTASTYQSSDDALKLCDLVLRKRKFLADQMIAGPPFWS